MAYMTLKYRAAALATILAAASPALLQAQDDGKTVATAHRDILLQADHSWNDKAYTHYPAGQPELTMIKLTIPPHTALPWHTHPFPNAAYVLSGTLTVHERDSGKTKVYHQGEAFAESVDTVHRGETGDETTVLLITYAGTPGVPTSIPAKGQKPEY
jgi:quercetin dioxygenase-like cupin family protein